MAISVMGNVALRNKYAFYVVSVGTAAGLFYLYSNGYNHWLYNPFMYRVWTYADLTRTASLKGIVLHRLYFLVFAIMSLMLSHVLFPRKSQRSFVRAIFDNTR
jgi:hypothetical protein